MDIFSTFYYQQVEIATIAIIQHYVLLIGYPCIKISNLSDEEGFTTQLEYVSNYKYAHAQAMKRSSKVVKKQHLTLLN